MLLKPPQRHVRAHSMEKPHACHRCPKRFGRPDNLDAHNRLHDENDASDSTHHLQLNQEAARIEAVEEAEEVNQQEDLVRLVEEVEALEAEEEDISVTPNSAHTPL